MDYIYSVLVDSGRPVETRHGPGCVDVTGYSSEEFAADPHLWIRMVCQEDRAKILEQVRQILAGARADPIEHRITRKDGAERWVSNTPVPHRGADGTLMGYDGLIRDVTERKRAEALIAAERDLGLALGEARFLHEALEKCLSTAIEISGMDCGGVYLVREDGGLDLTVHRGLGEGFVRSVTTFDHESPNARIVHAGAPVYAVWSALAFAPNDETEGERLRAFAAVPVRDRGVVVACMNVASHAVDEISPWARVALEDVAGRIGSAIVRTRAEESLRLAERQYKALFEELLDGFAVLEVVWGDRGVPADFRFIALNPAFERTTGFEAREIVGSTVMELFPSVDRSWIERCGPIVELGRPAHFEGYSTAFRFHFEATVFQPMPGQIACILKNVSERKQLEEQYRQSQKMEAVGRLAGGVAHDLNNMLTPILAYTEMLEDAFSPDDTRLQPIREVRAAGVRAKDLVRQLLAFSRKQTLRFNIVDLNAVISRLEPLLRHTVRENIALRLALAPKLPGVRGDVGQIEQAIMNLVINAQDAMPEGGEIAIETCDVSLDGEHAAAQADLAPGPYVEMAISDTGIGMDAAVMERMFEPFFTTKAVGKGTGLGLATVYGIVKQHGGSVTVSSELGAGATFRLYFPALEGASPAFPSEDGSPAVESGLPGEIIMVAEDDDMVRDLAAGVLRRQGYTVLTAANAAECVRALTAHRGSLHLLLTDVVMPDMNGKALFDIVAAIFPGARVIYMSGYSQEVISEQGVLLENIDFLQKPFTVRQLVALIREVLDRK
jgi:two-component system cell cycle sensor histidine kinase/response regulator CckA